MAEYVGMYRAKDGKLFESFQKADEYEDLLLVTSALSRLMDATVPGADPGWREEVSNWLVNHRGVISDVLRYPISAENAVDGFLSPAHPEEPEQVAA